MAGSSGALQRLGIQTVPMGTRAEVEALGLDPKEVACCAPSSPGSVRGCAMWNDCPFGEARMGGFKGISGPKYVGYFLMTHEGDKKEDFISCHSFVRTLKSRQMQAMVDKQAGRAAEIVRIVAQEGEPILTRVAVPDNAADKSINASYHFAVKEVPVPKMPRPDELDRVNYDHELTAREMQRQKFEEQVDEEKFSRLKPETQSAERLFSPDAPRRRGRPPKVAIAEPENA